VAIFAMLQHTMVADSVVLGPYSHHSDLATGSCGPDRHAMTSCRVHLWNYLPVGKHVPNRYGVGNEASVQQSLRNCRLFATASRLGCDSCWEIWLHTELLNLQSWCVGIVVIVQSWII